MEREWRLILDGRGDGYANMAVDEAILLNYPHYKIPTLRIYGWKSPFVSLGYNQNPKEVLRGDGLYFVRRMTGG
ncbi:MAG: lipoate--protein ligase family protein, partial [Candidatus Omnitrophota bacterium]